MNRIQMLAYVVFLVFYGAQKYLAVPEQMGELTYTWTTALMVVLTAVIPFFVSYILIPRLDRMGALLIGALLPLILSGVGLTIYYYGFIARYVPDIALTDVLPRALAPGIIMGLILVIPLVLAKDQSTENDAAHER